MPDKGHVYDKVSALTAVGGDEKTAQFLLEKFIELLPETEEAILAAYNATDYSALYDVIHKLAGSASIVAASAVYSEAMYLQKELKKSTVQTEQIEGGVSAILDEMACFRNYFASDN